VVNPAVSDLGFGPRRPATDPPGARAETYHAGADTAPGARGEDKFRTRAKTRMESVRDGPPMEPNDGARAGHRWFALVGAGALTVALVMGVLPMALGVSSAEGLSLANTTEFPVTFSERGLANGTNWSVTIHGLTHYSTGNDVVFSERDGTYRYTIGQVPGYTVPPAGNVTVNGTAVRVGITFAPIVTEYSITFTQSGLPTGHVWSVALNGTVKSTNGSSAIEFSEPNGIYVFKVGSVAGFQAHPATGKVVVNGSSVTKHIRFVPQNTTVPTVTSFVDPSAKIRLAMLSFAAQSGISVRELSHPYWPGVVPGSERAVDYRLFLRSV
jgi:hypothetical protein